MSAPSDRNNVAYTLAPHQLHNSSYNTEGLCSPYVLPPPGPLDVQSVVAPAVDCQARAYWDTPRIQPGVGGSIGIYSGYREYASLQPAIPANLPIGPSVTAQQVNYLGCPYPAGAPPVPQ